MFILVRKGKTRFGDSTIYLGMGWVEGGAGKAVLWNRNYFLRFRFRLLKSYGAGF
jgi:hypothetical protein